MTTVQEKQDVALMAHLLRRAGFGATADELDYYMSIGYEADRRGAPESRSTGAHCRMT